MLIDALPQVQQSHPLKSSGSQPHFSDKTDSSLPPGNRGVNVDISESGRLALEREMQNIAKARNNQEFVDFRGHDGNLRLGLWALGESTVDDWSAKGLEITEKTVLAAAEAFQSAFRKSLEDNGSSTAGASIGLNRHQIVMNSQAVPDWFAEEYESILSSMGDSAISNAFKNGETFFVSQLSAPNSEALSRYTDIKNRI